MFVRRGFSHDDFALSTGVQSTAFAHKVVDKVSGRRRSFGVMCIRVYACVCLAAADGRRDVQTNSRAFNRSNIHRACIQSITQHVHNFGDIINMTCTSVIAILFTGLIGHFLKPKNPYRIEIKQNETLLCFY